VIVAALAVLAIKESDVVVAVIREILLALSDSLGIPSPKRGPPLFCCWLPDGPADERRPGVLKGLREREAFLADNDIIQTFVPRAAFVRGRRGGGEPAFVDAAAVQAVGVGIIGMQLDAQAGLEERARHPVRREAQQSARAGKFGSDFAAGVLLDGFELGDGVRALFVRSGLVGAFREPQNEVAFAAGKVHATAEIWRLVESFAVAVRTAHRNARCPVFAGIDVSGGLEGALDGFEGSSDAGHE